MKKEIVIYSLIALIIGFSMGYILFHQNSSKSMTNLDFWMKISPPLYNFKNLDSQLGTADSFWQKHKIEIDYAIRIDTNELNHVFTSLECEEKLLSKNHPIAPNSNGEPVYFCLIERASYNFADCYCYYALN